MICADTDLAFALLDLARKKGASAADVLLVRSASLSATLRLGRTETVERSESTDVGLRVFKGRKQGLLSTSDLRPEKWEAMVERALAIAETTPEDPYAGLADPAQLLTAAPADLDLCDPVEPDASILIERAGTCEAAALAVPGVTNSSGGQADWSRSEIVAAATNGFHVSTTLTGSSLSAVVLAQGARGGMEQDYEYDTAVYGSDLRDAAGIGRRAGERAVRRIDPRPQPSGRFPVVFEPRLARGLLSTFCGAINGSTVARQATFLKDRMGEEVFSPAVTIVEDPFVQRGLHSRAVDGEGLLPQRRALIEKGRLTGWILDLRSARQLGLAPTGNALRGLSSAPFPSVTNVWIEAGTASVEDLIADIGEGVLVTQILGHGDNLVTGDYSRGASGFRIENGRITHPVNGLTIAGNLAEMFRSMTPANDLDRRYGVDSPTVRIDTLTVAGQ